MPHNRSIHGLRGLAVLMVLALHLYGAVATGGFPLRLGDDAPAAKIFSAGHRGVELFFMISGYLIVGSLARHRSATKFLVQRALRIYPAFLVPHLLIFAVGPRLGYAWMAGINWDAYLAHFVSNLLMLPGLFSLPLANIVAWTLSLELAFYLLAAAAFALSESPLPRIVRGALWLGWLAAAGTVLYHDPRASFFVVGVTVHFLDGGEETTPSRWSLPAWTGIAGLAGLCALFDYSLPLAAGCGLAGFLAIVRRHDLLCRFLDSRPLQYLGEISYSLYLWHMVVLFPLKRLFGRPGGLVAGETGNLFVFLTAAVVGSLLVAHLSWQLVERRFLSLKTLRTSADARRATPALALTRWTLPATLRSLRETVHSGAALMLRARRT